MGVGAFAFWATETFLLMCRIKNNVLVGRIVPSGHSAQKMLESRVFCHEAIAKKLDPKRWYVLTYPV